MTTTTSQLDAAHAQFRASLLARDAAALKSLMAAYQPVYTRIQAEVATLTAQIAAARATGERVRPSWLTRQGRLAALERQIVAVWAGYADAATQVITEAQRQAVVAAAREAQQLTLAAFEDVDPLLLLHAGTSITRLPVEAFSDLVGSLSDGSPLRDLLAGLGQQAAQDVGDALKHAVATGRNPRQTARDLRAALGGTLTRALTIARTEQMRSYRTASLRSYQENSDVLRGWAWKASPSRRTCPVCLAMDGTEHALDEPMASHPACRCTPTPILRNRPTPPHETGAEWFDRQPADVQRELLGPGKYDLYRDGRITLADLVAVRQDPRWGPTRRERSLGELREALGVAEGKKRKGAGGSSAGDVTPP